MHTLAGHTARGRWSSALAARRALASALPPAAGVQPTAAGGRPGAASTVSTTSTPTSPSSSAAAAPAPSPEAAAPPAPAPVSDGVEPSTSASAHLFALAAEEDAQPALPPSATRPHPLLGALDEQPWTGDEPLEAAVLRMLIDKHKPQRTGKIKSSDDRIREEVQKTALERMLDEEKNSGTQGMGGAVVRGGGGSGEEVESIAAAAAAGKRSGIKKITKVFPGHLVGGDPDHQPWMSEYVGAKSSDTPLIKRGHLLASRTSRAGVKDDPKLRAALRRERALQAGPVRAGNAREKALDFQLDKISVKGRRPTSSRLGQMGLDEIDEGLDVRVVMTPADYRIERARLEGAFDNLPGRGKPLVNTHTETSNPYIGRSEFFMNRIFQRNDVLPVWIDLQRQHGLALDGLRTSLTAMLHRRLLADPRLPPRASVAQIESLRVKEVEKGGAERAFWEGLVKECNSKGRSADGVAPPSTRKGTTSLDVELARAYPKAALLVHASLHAPPPATPPLNQIDVDAINWGMDWSWLQRWALWRWWMALRALWRDRKV